MLRVTIAMFAEGWMGDPELQVDDVVQWVQRKWGADKIIFIP